MRGLRAEDSERLLAWRNSDQVAPYMYSDHRISQDEHDRWFEGLPGRSDCRYWIIELDELPVGLASLSRIDFANRRCEWAYYLASPSTRGRGVGSCVELLVLDHVFGALGLGKLWCEVLIENEAVWKLHESFGFQREALFREHVYKAGRPRDVIGLGLLAGEWRGARPAALARIAAKGYDPERLSID
jgi:UDP-4-amino-4,6-dideoxy-N-acetyl-beta-L-altrosamine N-acetyltransferase